jgi:hypothetical protein
MENNKKPDWFELADNDQPAKRSTKPAKSTFAVVATLALATLAGWGFISHDESIAIASESTVPVTAVAAPSSVSPSASSNIIINPPTSKSDDSDHESSHDN